MQASVLSIALLRWCTTVYNTRGGRATRCGCEYSGPLYLSGALEIPAAPRRRDSKPCTAQERWLLGCDASHTVSRAPAGCLHILVHIRRKQNGKAKHARVMLTTASETAPIVAGTSGDCIVSCVLEVVQALRVRAAPRQAQLAPHKTYALTWDVLCECMEP